MNNTDWCNVHILETDSGCQITFDRERFLSVPLSAIMRYVEQATGAEQPAPTDQKIMVAWRVAELRQRGIEASPYLIERSTTEGDARYSILVRCPVEAAIPEHIIQHLDDGFVLEDPTHDLRLK